MTEQDNPPPEALQPDLLAFIEALARADADHDYDAALAKQEGGHVKIKADGGPPEGSL